MSWLPSSWTSTRPSLNSGWRLIAGLPASRTPAGEYGVARACRPSASRRASTSSRLDAREIDAQVERRGVGERLRDAQRLFLAMRAREAKPQPVGQLGAHRGRLVLAARGAQARDEVVVEQTRERATGEAEHPDQRRRHQQRAARRSPPPPRASACGAAPRTPSRRRTRAPALPEGAVAAEIAGKSFVGGAARSAGSPRPQPRHARAAPESASAAGSRPRDALRYVLTTLAVPVHVDDLHRQAEIGRDPEIGTVLRALLVAARDPHRLESCRPASALVLAPGDVVLRAATGPCRRRC